MSKKFLAALAALATTAVAPVMMAPLASADDGSCNPDPTVTVCDDGGSAAIVATPPQVDPGPQNGPYGPAGSTAPVGGSGL
ncbi:hypothetical protein H7K45_14275 [Mycobacterium yunnanensis]|uniref:Intersectin-EH binding protein Ibp1 n=1 Tax=Mycobacterium yunnanensis TaxID=368477 RepID=A0A9X2Z2N8_9MYCO|nr:hypothetical protein [Mycobacterium yunnanensis]MCV7421711.1 hypothetical protein [Mycobacterium yunnanensis]